MVQELVPPILTLRLPVYAASNSAYVVFPAAVLVSSAKNQEAGELPTAQAGFPVGTWLTPMNKQEPLGQDAS